VLQEIENNKNFTASEAFRKSGRQSRFPAS